MKGLGLIALVVLVVIMIMLIRYLAAGADLRLRNRQLRTAPWRRTEYVDEVGITHVVLRRTILDGAGREVWADNDIEIEIVLAGRDFADRLNRARSAADLRAEQMNAGRQ